MQSAKDFSGYNIEFDEEIWNKDMDWAVTEKILGIMTSAEWPAALDLGVYLCISGSVGLFENIVSLQCGEVSGYHESAY